MRNLGTLGLLPLLEMGAYYLVFLLFKHLVVWKIVDMFVSCYDMPKRQRLQSVPVEIANVFAQQRLAYSAFAVVFNMFLQMFM